MTSTPSPNRPNGRDARGRFAKGNPGGPGNPLARRVGQLRAALVDEVSERYMRGIAHQLLQLALRGDLAAIRLLLERVLGPPTPLDILARLEKLEELASHRPTTEDHSWA